MKRLGWLTSSAWMDEDGEHVWSAHDCLDDQRVVTMLPHPTWEAGTSATGCTIVLPSIVCETCGYHDTHQEIGQPPAQWLRASADRIAPDDTPSERGGDDAA